jgi:hypothetical protein
MRLTGKKWKLTDLLFLDLVRTHRSLVTGVGSAWKDSREHLIFRIISGNEIDPFPHHLVCSPCLP